MDEFVKNAFKSAKEALADEEFAAYERRFIKDDRGDMVNMVAVLRTGIERVDKMLSTIGEENLDIISNYIANIIIITFHEGYLARMEDER